MKDNEPPKAGDAASAILPCPANPYRLLLADDDGDTRQLSFELLADAGYDVEAVNDGAAGWDALQAKSYDLVITDNKMPKMTGMELIEKLRAAHMAVPVIMATAYAPTHEFDRKPWLMPDATLPRPYLADELLVAVKRVLRKDDRARFAGTTAEGDRAGVRPSSGAAVTAGSGASELSEALDSPEPAAPAGGRTPASRTSPDDDRSGAGTACNAYQAGESKVIQCNIRHITERKQGEIASRRLAAIVASSDDAIIGHLNAELEQRVVERTAQLQAANSELEAFSYSVSHDLRAPLRHILGFVELLQKDAGRTLSKDSLLHLTTISQAAEQMGQLVDDLLAFSRLGQARLQQTEVNLNQLVREALSGFQTDTKDRNIAWELHRLPSVRADRALLRVVLVNLISNAVKFTGTRSQARIEIGCAPGGEGETVIFVRDNGVGFDPRYTAKLFGVFQRLHNRDEFEGTGIGLANVQRIIHRHGGRTWAEGVVDGGATFYFSIPTSI